MIYATLHSRIRGVVRFEFLFTCLPIGSGYKMDPRLREFSPAAIGSQDAGFTQPRAHS